MADKKITCSASPRAVVVLTGLLGLRKARPGEPSCSLEENGDAIWRLRHGIVVTCEISEGGSVAHWHLAHDDDPPLPSPSSRLPQSPEPNTEESR